MLHASDLLEPKGELDPGLWPGIDLSVVSANIEEYLTEGYGRAAPIADAGDKDEAAKQWSYYRAFGQAYRRLVRNPSTVSLNDEGSASTLLTQIEHVGELSDKALAAFNDLLSGAVVDE